MALQKTKLKLLTNKKFTETVFLMTYSSSEKIAALPGQYGSLVMGERLRRPYTVFEIKDNGDVVFLIDIAPGGDASKYFEQTKVGDEIEGYFSMGDFVYHKTGRPIVMISTGTGIAPIIPILKHLNKETFTKEVIHLWGIRTEKDNYSDWIFDFENLDIKNVVCISQPEGEGEFYHGRVTKYLNAELVGQIEFNNYDYYVCGRKEIVRDIVTSLESLSIKREYIYAENY